MGSPLPTPPFWCNIMMPSPNYPFGQPLLSRRDSMKMWNIHVEGGNWVGTCSHWSVTTTALATTMAMPRAYRATDWERFEDPDWGSPGMPTWGCPVMPTWGSLPAPTWGSLDTPTWGSLRAPTWGSLRVPTWGGLGRRLPHIIPYIISTISTPTFEKSTAAR